ncbi:dTDP-4-dehydrorhamnose 3,5-epimerase [Chitinibacter fontanus]|uniref:dTDP-4-dehydrorhamnose 3,5-epimerase n=1 Tax=Chitinibacter fontanus TaxID=1737446 RepID=A0A7D5V872_9NEIS|nr:dTDP-4-dehydrorhamnose 3,5-epimerase [Chitinibacter fontanus]QLI80515.1 dTDP-4-dehydrorhamnose 3,5-epimerase [Chitinibacter fontanus]
MKVIDTIIPEVKIIQPSVFHDKRGYFLESYNQLRFEEYLGRQINFVQDNHSHSVHRVLRGLHYQIGKPQGKLVRVTKGEVFDVAVDLRESSTTFGQWTGRILSSENHEQLWIPEGFAHGFYVLSATADLHYKSTDFWFPECERTILWDDGNLNIQWPLTMQPIVSDKDAKGIDFSRAEKFR